LRKNQYKVLLKGTDLKASEEKFMSKLKNPDAKSTSCEEATRYKKITAELGKDKRMSKKHYD